MLLNTIRKTFPVILLAIDTIAFYLIYYLIYIIRTGSSTDFFSSDQILFTMVACNATALYLIGGYEYKSIDRTARFISEHVLASIVGAVFSLFIILLFISYGDRVGTNRTSLLGTFILFSIYSIFYRCLVGHLKLKRKGAKCTVILGLNDHSYELIKEIQKQNYQEQLYLVGDNFDEKIINQFISINVQILNINKFDPKSGKVDNKGISRILLAEDINKLNINSEFKESLFERHMNFGDVISIERFFLTFFQYVPLSSINDSWPFKSGFRVRKTAVYIHAKRAIDLLLSFIVLILASPAIIIAMLAVKVTSRGPVFFKQTRIGEKEIPFTLLKLRTMQVGSDAKGDYTQENDPRITSIGNFLRKTRLDELPQLFNVIKGDMSLIGPRAEWDKLVNTYENEIPHYHFRHISKPGITGWAQVNYPYGANLEDTKNKLKYDLYYVRYYSLTMDFTIIIKTAYTMIFGRGR